MTNGERVPETAAGEGPAGRLVGALVHPQSTFASIAAKPSWLLPLLLLTALNVTLTFTYGRRVGWREFMEKQYANNSRVAEMSPEARTRAIDRAVRLAPVFGYIGGTAGTTIVLLAIAGLFLAAFNIIFGTGIRFGRSFGVVVHAFLPQVLRGLLGLVVVLTKPPEGVDLQNLVASNAAAFLPAGVSQWLKVLAGSMDLFSFWTLALLAIGFSAASSPRKLSVGTTLAVVLSLWVIYLAGAVGFTALFS